MMEWQEGELDHSQEPHMDINCPMLYMLIGCKLENISYQQKSG